MTSFSALYKNDLRIKIKTLNFLPSTINHKLDTYINASRGNSV